MPGQGSQNRTSGDISGNDRRGPSKQESEQIMRPEASDIVSTTPVAAFGGIALRGALQTGLGQIVQMGSQFLSVILLSRLLEPGDFGVIAMSAPVLALINVFKDFGLLQAVVQKKDLTYGQLNALFWVNSAISLGIALVLLAISPAVGHFYDDARVGIVLMAMTLPVLATGFSAQQTALLTRQMNFGALSLITAIQALTSLVVSYGWAVIAPSYWALFGGYFAGSTIALILSWMMCGWMPGRPEGAAGVRGLLGFGAGVTGFNFANFFSRNLDNVLIGRFWGSDQLGLYDRSYKLLLFPLQQVANPLGRVMVPILSRLADEPERYRRAFFRVLNMMQLLLLPGIALLVALADTAIPFLLGERFREAAPIFAALGMSGLLQVSSNPTGWLFVSQGRSTEMAKWGLISAIITCTAIAIGAFFGTFWVAVLYTASAFVKLLPMWAMICRTGPITRTSVIRSGLPMLLAGFGSLAIVWLIGPYLPGSTPWQLLIGLLIAYVSYVGLILMTPAGRECLQDVRQVLAGRLGKLPSST